MTNAVNVYPVYESKTSTKILMFITILIFLFRIILRIAYDFYDYDYGIHNILYIYTFLESWVVVSTALSIMLAIIFYFSDDLSFDFVSLIDAFTLVFVHIFYFPILIYKMCKF